MMEKGLHRNWICDCDTIQLWSLENCPRCNMPNPKISSRFESKETYIARRDLAKSTGFDPGYVAKLIKNKRKPSEIENHAMLKKHLEGLIPRRYKLFFSKAVVEKLKSFDWSTLK